MSRGEFAFPEDALEYIEAFVMTTKKLKLYLKRESLRDDERTSNEMPRPGISSKETHRFAST